MELDKRGAELLFQVLTERGEKASVATNPSPAGRKPSPTRGLCAAIVDRLTFNGTIIETWTDSYRLAHTGPTSGQLSRHQEVQCVLVPGGMPVEAVDSYEVTRVTSITSLKVTRVTCQRLRYDLRPNPWYCAQDQRRHRSIQWRKPPPPRKPRLCGSGVSP
jgi:hypothetical protein